VFVSSIAAAVLKNITITVPDGTSNHGDPNLICKPTTWTDIIVFFLGNYLAHAATIKSLPGEYAGSFSFAVVVALLFPPTGMARGLSAIFSFSKLSKTDLQSAARAGALCMVVRTSDWKPQPGDVVADVAFVLRNPTLEQPSEIIQTRQRKQISRF